MKPKLRFPGFQEEWEEKKFSKDTYIKARVGWKNLKAEEYVDEGVPMIAGKHIHLGKIDWENVDFITKERYEESLEIALQNGDIIFSKDGTLGNPAYIENLKGEATINGTMMLIRLSEKKDGLNSRFFYYILQSSSFLKLVSIIKSGGTVPHIFQRDIINFKFYSPISLAEQEKIGAFLSKVDEQIEKQEKKVELLKERKKGWIQQLFSQSIRFKDENGQDYPAWEEKKLGDILIEVSNKTTKNNQYMLLSSTNNGLYNQLEYFTNQVASKDNTGYKILKRNQLVLSPQNLWLGNINFNNKFDVGIVSPSYKIFNIKNENLDFINYLLHTSKAFYYYKNASEQGASVVRRNLNMDLFYDIYFSIPSLPEQEKIAEFLAKQDELIEKEEEKLSLLKEQKKGLLQQMFV